MGAEAMSATTRSEIRRAALWASVVVWLMGTVMLACFYGQNFGRASTVAGVSALGALVAWVIYHAISQRNDGIMIIIIATSGLGPTRGPMLRSLNDELTLRVLLGVVTCTLSIVFGLVLRKSGKHRGQSTDSPLWDADVDRVSA
jgi:hypothetical protein